MGKCVVYATESFKKLYESLTKDEQTWIKSIKEQLGDHPTGKPLHCDWFREKKYLDKRLYFLVDEERRKILFMSFAPKKDQQKIINFIVSNKDELLTHLKNL
jgi:hypothetical protein